jgi:hypothetical protein
MDLFLEENVLKAENLQTVEDYEDKVGIKVHSSLKIHKIITEKRVLKNFGSFQPFLKIL